MAELSAEDLRGKYRTERKASRSLSDLSALLGTPRVEIVNDPAQQIKGFSPVVPEIDAEAPLLRVEDVLPTAPQHLEGPPRARLEAREEPQIREEEQKVKGRCEEERREQERKTGEEEKREEGRREEGKGDKERREEGGEAEADRKRSVGSAVEGEGTLATYLWETLRQCSTKECCPGHHGGRGPRRPLALLQCRPELTMGERQCHMSRRVWQFSMWKGRVRRKSEGVALKRS